MMNDHAATTCGVERAMEIIGGKWTLLLLRDLMTGPKRFCDLERSLAGISTRTLTHRLEELTAEKIIERDCSSGHPVYRVTEAGASLHEIIDQLRFWGERRAVASS